MQQQVYQVAWRFLLHDDVMRWVIVQGEAVADVASIWNCKKSVAKTLLMNYMWDKDKLMSECPAVCLPECADHGVQLAHSAAVSPEACVACSFGICHLTGVCSIRSCLWLASTAARHCMSVQLSSAHQAFGLPAAANTAWLSAVALPHLMLASSCR